MIRDAIGGVTQRSAGRSAYVGLFYVALVLRLLVPLTTGGLAGAFGYDASVYYASGAALVHARVPYRDFILLHPPGAMLATAPAAWVGSWTSDQAGFAVVTMLFAAAGAANAVLVAAIARRLGLSRGASMVGGLFYAAWFGAVHAEYQSRLEPLANFLLLCGLLGYAGIGRRHGRRAAILCGAGLGAAACVKVWYAVPLAVVVGWLLVVDRRRWAAGRVALGAVAAITVICGPFLALAPTAMWEMVISWQLGRDQSNSLRQVLMLQRLPDAIPSWWLAVAIDGVVLIVAALLVVLARRVPTARLPVALVFAQAAVLVAAPSFLFFYLDLLTPAGALCVAAGAMWRPAPRRRMIDRVAARTVASAAVVVVVGVLLAPAVGLWYGRGSSVGRFPSQQLAPAVRHSRCVMSDSPMGLIVLNSLSRNLANGCSNWVDVTGRTYAPDMAVRRPDGQRIPRDANLVWQRALRDYLLSGDAIIIRRATDTGMSPGTWEAIRGGGVLAAQDGQVVYRVNRRSSSHSRARYAVRLTSRFSGERRPRAGVWPRCCSDRRGLGTTQPTRRREADRRGPPRRSASVSGIRARVLPLGRCDVLHPARRAAVRQECVTDQGVMRCLRRCRCGSRRQPRRHLIVLGTSTMPVLPTVLPN
jgi:alpha-1,2-mannosyltransferase